jgi:hypothetical protein
MSFTALEYLIDKTTEDSERHMERAIHFHENDNPEKAIQDLSISLENFVYTVELIDRIKKKSSKTGYDKEEEMDFISGLSSFIILAIKCYIKLEKVDEIKYCFAKLKAIVVELEKNERNLSVSLINKLEELRRDVMFFERTATEAPHISAAYLLANPDFVKIKDSIDKAYTLSICPLGPRISSSNESCFIATAVYGTSEHADLDTFRQFRDDQLLGNSLGRKLVRVYYQIGPKIAILLSMQSPVQRGVRRILQLIAISLRKSGVTAR